MQTDTHSIKEHEVHYTSCRAFVQFLVSLTVFCIHCLHSSFLFFQEVNKTSGGKMPRHSSETISFSCFSPPHVIARHCLCVGTSVSPPRGQTTYWRSSVLLKEEVHCCTFGFVKASVLDRQRCRVQPLNESRTDTLTFSLAVVCPCLINAADPQMLVYRSHYFVKGSCSQCEPEVVWHSNIPQQIFFPF